MSHPALHISMHSLSGHVGPACLPTCGVLGADSSPELIIYHVLCSPVAPTESKGEIVLPQAFLQAVKPSGLLYTVPWLFLFFSNHESKLVDMGTMLHQIPAFHDQPKTKEDQPAPIAAISAKGYIAPEPCFLSPIPLAA